MSTHVFSKLLNKLTKRDKMQHLRSTSSVCNTFDKFNNTGIRMLDSFLLNNVASGSDITSRIKIYKPLVVY